MTLFIRFCLWLAFSLLALAAIPLSLALLVADEWPYAKRLLAAMDRLGAALLGYSGRRTISAECGDPANTCRFCALVCALLERIERDHCSNAAQTEGYQ